MSSAAADRSAASATPAAPAALSLDDAVRFVRGVGPGRGAALERAGIVTVRDLLFTLPFRHEDRARFAPVSAARPGDTYTLCGTLRGTSLRRIPGRRLSIFTAVVDDGTAALEIVWFNQPYLDEQLSKGDRVVLHGAVRARRGGGMQMTAPEFESLGADDDGGASVHIGRVVPVYSRVEGMPPRPLRRAVWNVLADLDGQSVAETLPTELVRRHALPPLAGALAAAHFPATAGDAENGRARLVYEEFLRFQLGLALTRAHDATGERAPAHRIDDTVRARARAILPFKLTAAQKRAVREIADDLRSERPMARLLQGDVGSGKTAVALLALLITLENGYQGALMAPTEILAEQHALTLRQRLAGSPWTVALLTSATPRPEREALLERLAAGEAILLVGTQALIQEGVALPKLGLVVVDEQHRFGVLQREALRRKGTSPHLLVMTATPIPRSLALTLYGDLDVSVLDELPPGRTPIKTVLRGGEKRAAVFDFVRKQIAEGAQAYVVVPLVEESERLDARALERAYTEACTELRGSVVAKLHGGMPSREKDQAMRQFAAGVVHALVATTVVEVGIDVSNASVMLIENAERFGLAQLHQLRGRVGRGPRPSYCILLRGEKISAEAAERLRFFVANDDGFTIAEKDLEMRGPGDIAGVRQSGMPVFRVGNIVRDRHWMEQARTDAHELLAAPTPRDAVTAALLASAETEWRERSSLAGAG